MQWQRLKPLGSGVAYFVAFFTVSYLFRTLTQQGYAPKSAYERAMVSSLKARKGYEEFVKLSKTSGDSAGAYGKAASITRAGLARLSPERQAERARLLYEWYGDVPLHSCAVMASGKADGKTVAAMFTRLDSASLAQFTDIVAEAMLAQVRGTPPARSATDEEVKDMLMGAMEGLDSADVIRFVTAAQGTASDEDTCWMMRRLYLRAVEAPEESRADRLRALTFLESQNPQQ